MESLDLLTADQTTEEEKPVDNTMEMLNQLMGAVSTINDQLMGLIATVAAMGKSETPEETKEPDPEPDTENEGNSEGED